MLRPIPKGDYVKLISGARLIESDRRGPKVYATTDDRIVKLFRVKRRISSNLLQAYARRFATNADALLRVGIEAPRVDFYGKVPHIDRQIVIYPMMPGTSLRDWLRESDPSPARELMRRFGCFLAELHGNGVQFRSIHFGNVLVNGDDMSLIDVLDLKVFRTPLPDHRRLQNMRFLVRCPEDREMVRVHLEPLREGYGSVFPGYHHLFSELDRLAGTPIEPCRSVRGVSTMPWRD